jgi:hypothetical protein
MHILDALPRSALTNVTVAHRPRLHGHSNYSVSMLLAEMVKIARRGALRIGPRPGRPGDLGNGRPPADSA